jgi:GR25 family glycosyltransferase involved in LPS biosynthesis
MSDDFKFPPVIVVTLAEEPWKGKQTSKHLNALEIEHTIHEGTQGVTIGLRATNPYDYDQHGSPLFMHISQIGCVLSHRNALSVAIASGHRSSLWWRMTSNFLRRSS